MQVCRYVGMQVCMYMYVCSHTRARMGIQHMLHAFVVLKLHPGRVVLRVLGLQGFGGGVSTDPSPRDACIGLRLRPRAQSFRKKQLEQWLRSAVFGSVKDSGNTVQALVIRIGSGRILCHNYNKEPPKPYSNYSGSYIRVEKYRRSRVRKAGIRSGLCHKNCKNWDYGVTYQEGPWKFPNVRDTLLWNPYNKLATMQGTILGSLFPETPIYTILLWNWVPKTIMGMVFGDLIPSWQSKDMDPLGCG